MLQAYDILAPNDEGKRLRPGVVVVVFNVNQPDKILVAKRTDGLKGASPSGHKWTVVEGGLGKTPVISEPAAKVAKLGLLYAADEVVSGPTNKHAAALIQQSRPETVFEAADRELCEETGSQKRFNFLAAFLKPLTYHFEGHDRYSGKALFPVFAFTSQKDFALTPDPDRKDGKPEFTDIRWSSIADAEYRLAMGATEERLLAYRQLMRLARAVQEPFETAVGRKKNAQRIGDQVVRHLMAKGFDETLVTRDPFIPTAPLAAAQAKLTFA